jgi:Domain of unknown function (DUF4252)
MKKMLFILIASLPALAFAQNSLQSFYDKYAGQEGFTTVKIAPKMFELVASAELDDEDLSIIKDITGMNVLVCENEDGKNTARAAQLTEEVYAAIGEGYDELMSVKEDGTDLKILAKSAGNGIVSDLLIVGNDDGEFLFVSISGKLDLKKLKELDGKINIDGFDHLKDIDIEKK